MAEKAVRPAKQPMPPLAELRAIAGSRRGRANRLADAASLIETLLGQSRLTAIEPRAAGAAFRFEGSTGSGDFAFTCVLHDPPGNAALTSAEWAVAKLLCQSRTLAAIARERGVSRNTVKSQVRQIFRKLDVDSRVALARLLCP